MFFGHLFLFCFVLLSNGPEIPLYVNICYEDSWIAPSISKLGCTEMKKKI